MIETIKEFIVMYAPTVILAVSTVASYLTTFKALKSNVAAMVENNTIKSLTRELEETKALLRQTAQDNAEIKRTQKELINEISRVQKYENIGADEKI
nr:MAG TPA: oxidoreductase [Bacteriophage sp.]